MKYEQLQEGERKEIETYVYERQYSLRRMAKIMKRSVSTISREIRRNRNFFTKEYRFKTAKQKAYVRKKYCKYQSMKIIKDMKLRKYIETHLREDWSPEEISGRI